MPTEPQIIRLYAIARSKGWTRDGVHRLIESNYGKKSTKDLTIEQYDTCCAFLEKSINADIATMKQDPNTPDLFKP